MPGGKDSPLSSGGPPPGEGLGIQVDEMHLAVGSQEGGQVQVIAVTSPENAEPTRALAPVGREEPGDFCPMAK